MELRLASGDDSEKTYKKAKEMGFLDKTIRRLTGKEIQNPMLAGYSMVDTCAAEFTAETPYFYANFGGDNEAAEYIANQNSGKRRVAVSYTHLMSEVIRAKIAKAPVTCEVAPHHLWFTNTDYRVNPPIRTKKDRDRSYQTHDTCDAIRSGSACKILQHRDGSRTALDDRSQNGSNDNAQHRRIRYLKHDIRKHLSLR